MGLDSVELVMTFEEDFNVDIPDAVAGSMMTPRHVIDFLFQKRGVGSGPCLSQRAFHRLRRALMRLGHERQALRPETRLGDLFPPQLRIVAWVRLGQELGCSPWFALERSEFLRVLIALTSFVILCYGAWHAGWLLGVAAACVFGALAMWATIPFRSEFPGHILPPTLEGLVNRLLLEKLAHFAAPERGFAREQIADQVKRIVIEQLGIAPELYGEDKRFVEDLGMN